MARRPPGSGLTRTSEPPAHSARELLPEEWQGEFTVERARAWIEERERDSTTLLITETVTRQPVGLVILAVIPQHGDAIDRRIGYLMSENQQGEGFGGEVLAGLVDWARHVPEIVTSTGGVDAGNEPSLRLLDRAGFGRIDGPGDDQHVFRLDVAEARER